MKSIITSGIFLLLTIFAFQPVQGQRLLRRIQEKAQERVEKKVEERIDEKIDEKIDEGLDKIEESLEKNKDSVNSSGSSQGKSERDAERQQRMAGILQNIGISGEPVPIEDNYNFDYSIQMHVESFDKSGKKIDKGEFITYLNPNSKSMAYRVISGNMAEQGQGMFILDSENGAMIMLADENEEKTGIVYGMGAFFQSMGQTYEEEYDLSDSPETYLANPNVTKTGRTKTIAGYKCEEYTYKDENADSEVWITRDMNMNTQDFFSTLFKTSVYSHGMGWGYMMAATSVDRNNGEKSTMEVTKVDKNSNVKFSMGDYKITNLGSFTVPVEE